MHSSVSILGSTGSIGTQSLEVLKRFHPEISINFLTTNSNIELLEEQVAKFNPSAVAIANISAATKFRENTNFKGRIIEGEASLVEAASDDNHSLIISSLVGFSGVLPTLGAIRAGKTIALANKETLVSAGEFIIPESLKYNAPIVAVDSEHSAILQCLVGENYESIEKIILTASGGPFRNLPIEKFDSITKSDALKHPNWSMGAKITIDSATLVNKGFEAIEAKWLFNLNASQIEAIIHPQSIVHSFVQFVDGSVKAQLGLPDMMLPIHYAIGFPKRTATDLPRMSFKTLAALEFEQPDLQKFPCLSLAYQAMQHSGAACAIVNAANEIAVKHFLDEEIKFTSISKVIEHCLEHLPTPSFTSIEDIVALDENTRIVATDFCSSIKFS